MARSERSAETPKATFPLPLQAMASGNLLPENVSMQSILGAQAEFLRRMAAWHERAAACLERAAAAESNMTHELGHVAGATDMGSRWFQLCNEMWQLSLDETNGLIRVAMGQGKTEAGPSPTRAEKRA